MSKSISIYLLTIFIICGFGVLNPVLSDDEDSTHLFTENEAKELRYSNKEWEKESVPKHEPDTLDRPSILFEEPEVLDMKKGPTIIAITPTNFFVVIKQNNSPLDMGDN